MKNLKVLSILVAAALLLTPACAMARTNFSLSLNLFDFFVPRYAAPAPVFIAQPPPPPVVYYPVRPVYYYPQHHHTCVKEYHYYHQCPQEHVEEINPPAPYYPCNPYNR